MKRATYMRFMLFILILFIPLWYSNNVSSQMLLLPPYPFPRGFDFQMFHQEALHRADIVAYSNMTVAIVCFVVAGIVWLGPILMKRKERA